MLHSIYGIIPLKKEKPRYNFGFYLAQLYLNPFPLKPWNNLTRPKIGWTGYNPCKIMGNSIYGVQAIGFEANQVLKRHTSLEVFGTSSKGIYLQTQNDLTLFASSEDYRGPLTINFSGDRDGLPAINPRSTVNFQESCLEFPGAKVKLRLDDPEIWSPGPPPVSSRIKTKYIDGLYNRIKNLAVDDPFFPLLEMVFKSTSAPLAGFPEFFKQMIFIKKSIQTGDATKLVWEIENLLGVGPGLTPLGDDFILGILLAINRGKTKLTGSHLEDINQAVIDLALDKTTRLSFSLLVCGADGSADERLLNVFDGLLSGSEISDNELQQMLNWGSTSGYAVLAGMILALIE